MNNQIDTFIENLIQFEFDNVFNPYSDICCENDAFNSPFQRKNILRQMLLNAEACNVEAIWIGRDLGYRGGRRTGLAFTDDYSYDRHLARWCISQPSEIPKHRIKEQTATVVWQMLDKVDNNIFLWNLFPFHPYEEGNPFSNRCHNAREREIGLMILDELIAILKPNYLLTVGNEAYQAVSSNFKDMEVIKVRHPSYGGKENFIRKIAEIYRVDKSLKTESNRQISFDL